MYVAPRPAGLVAPAHSRRIAVYVFDVMSYVMCYKKTEVGPQPSPPWAPIHTARFSVHYGHSKHSNTSTPERDLMHLRSRRDSLFEVSEARPVSAATCAPSSHVSVPILTRHRLAHAHAWTARTYTCIHVPKAKPHLRQQACAHGACMWLCVLHP